MRKIQTEHTKFTKMTPPQYRAEMEKRNEEIRFKRELEEAAKVEATREARERAEAPRKAAEQAARNAILQDIMRKIKENDYLIMMLSCTQIPNSGGFAFRCSYLTPFPIQVYRDLNYLIAMVKAFGTLHKIDPIDPQKSYQLGINPPTSTWTFIIEGRGFPFFPAASLPPEDEPDTPTTPPDDDIDPFFS